MNASLPPATGFLGDLEARAKAENPDLVRTPPSLREPSPRPSTPGPPTSIVLPVDNAAPVASTSTLDAPGAATTPSTTVAVKKKRPLPASPPPRKPKKPQPTIRLEIDLFSRLEGSKDEAYELNFEEEAVEAGLRVIQSESERDDSESDGSDDDSEEDVQPQVCPSLTLLLEVAISMLSRTECHLQYDRYASRRCAYRSC